MTTTTILLYPGVTALDAIGPYEVLGRLPGMKVQFAAREKGEIRTDTGSLGLMADYSISQIEQSDIVLVPGGPGDRKVREDRAVLDWLVHMHARTTWTTSVCTGSLILGEAGLLKGVRATTYWACLDLLSTWGATAVQERFVEDGKIVTAAGVSAGIDMALHLVGKMMGDTVAQAVQLGIEYDPQPTYHAGSPQKAPPEVLAAVRAVIDASPSRV